MSLFFLFERVKFLGAICFASFELVAEDGKDEGEGMDVDAGAVLEENEEEDEDEKEEEPAAEGEVWWVWRGALGGMSE